MKRILLSSLVFLAGLSLFSQQQVDGLTYDSYNNAKNTYNYTYWNTNWKTNGVSNRIFTNHTSSYNLAIDYTNLNIESLSINQDSTRPSIAFQNSYQTTFPVQQPGDIDVKILQDDQVLYQVDKSQPTNNNKLIGQMVNYGTWCTRRVIDDLNFTPTAPVIGTHTGIEFTNWHNRFRIASQLKPQITISNARMQLSIQMPEVYDTVYFSNGVFGFGKSSGGEGFAVKGGSTADSVSVCGNTIHVFTKQQNLNANVQYQLSLIFYPVKDNLHKTFEGIFDDASEVTVTASQTKPDNSGQVSISYSNDEGLYYVGIPEYKMGYNSKSTIDVMQNINMHIENTNNYDKRVRLCFNEDAPKNVVGFSSMLRNPNGDPTGLPLQITKNWHKTYSKLYSGSWVQEYTEVIVPANSVLNFDYTRVGARWGKVFGAFSHQLCVVGAGVPRGGWLEAGLGGFAENITFSPDIEYGNANVCDYRPFLCTNQYYGGTSSEYSWTGNLGGMNILNYENSRGEIDYQSQVKTRFTKYGPNLSETAISTYSSDNKLKMDYSYYLNRSDDFLRVYFKIKMKVLEDVNYTRFDFFQMGHDTYRNFRAQSIAYGNMDSLMGTFTPASGKTGYTTSAIALPGEDPWVWGGDALRVKSETDYGSMNIDANNSFIVRSYQASFDGLENNTPYFRERTTYYKDQYPTSYCLVPPPGVNGFTKGDSVEMILELCLMPKVDQVYYGPNVNFKKALTEHGNEWRILHREVVGNKIDATSETNELSLDYPLTVKTGNNTATVTVNGGVGYIPIVFSNLTSISDPKLYLVADGGDVLIDQSNHGKDFWQAEYDMETGLYELIYNLNHDTPEDTLGRFTYRLEVAPSDGPNSSVYEPGIPESNVSPQHYLNTTTVCYPVVEPGNIKVDFNVEDASNGESMYGVLLAINNKVYATNDYGYVQLNLSDLEYEFSISKAGYHAHTQSLNVTKDTSLTISLSTKEKFDLSLQITDSESDTKLSNVTVTVGDSVFTTNENGILTCTLWEGDYVLTLEKYGYNMVSHDVYLLASDAMALTMTRSHYTLSLELIDEGTSAAISGAIVTVGIYGYKTDETGVISLQLAPGEYTYSILKEGYQTQSGIFLVSGDDSVTIELRTLVGVQSLEQARLKIYPNPACDQIIIQGMLLNNNVIQLYSLTGANMVQNIPITGTNAINKLNVENIPSGLYLLRIGECSTRIQIQK